MNTMNQCFKKLCEMKVLGIILLYAVAVQGRTTAVDHLKSGNSADISEAPWLAHLRRAVSTSGLLETSVGSVITPTFVLTTAESVKDARFIFVRLGSTHVVFPSLVIETNSVRIQSETHPVYDALALVSLNRVIQFTENISPVALTYKADVPESTTFYFYGNNGDDGPGEELKSITVELYRDESSITGYSKDGRASWFDIGAPLVADGEQFALLTAAYVEDSAGIFQRIREDDLTWIKGQTGL